MTHHFHIPVLGLAFSIDTPVKVAHLGISSVISIVDDELIERMRAFHCHQAGLPYYAITPDQDDYRAKRIESYLNLVGFLVSTNTHRLRNSSMEENSEIHQYFHFLPQDHPAKVIYHQMLSESDPALKIKLQTDLRKFIKPGQIEVNIMSKVDKINLNTQKQPLDEKFSDALAALRGSAKCELELSLVLSAGMNPRLYAYLGELEEFRMDKNGKTQKKIVLKVSDYRSALIQAKFLAKKGVWISEFRIESGLNCGGHAFATDGYLLGPILEEFKNKKETLVQELYELYAKALGSTPHNTPLPNTKITVQGGIGTAEEQDLLMQYYQMNGTGWGSPFLLVPEATTVDQDTLVALSHATLDDFYVSGASPLGVPFNNFRHSSAELQRLDRIAKNRPGSPCVKKYLVSNTEFTKEPICTASRKYQHLKIKQLENAELSPEEHKRQLNDVLEKTCLCEGLSASAYIKNDILKSKENRSVAICPGPNLAWFNRSYSLKEMVDHIYGRVNLLQHAPERPNLFVNELQLYMEHLKQFIGSNQNNLHDKTKKYITKFRDELTAGIDYYEKLCHQTPKVSPVFSKQMLSQLQDAKNELERPDYYVF